MIGYILFFGMAAGIIWTGFNRSKSENGIMADGLRAVLFFFAGIYFTASAIKLYLGEAQSTLSERQQGVLYLIYRVSVCGGRDFWLGRSPGQKAMDAGVL